MYNYDVKIRLNILVFVQNPTNATLINQQSTKTHNRLYYSNIKHHKTYMYTFCIYNNKSLFLLFNNK